MFCPAQLKGNFRFSFSCFIHRGAPHPDWAEARERGNIFWPLASQPAHAVCTYKTVSSLNLSDWEDKSPTEPEQVGKRGTFTVGWLTSEKTTSPAASLHTFNSSGLRACHKSCPSQAQRRPCILLVISQS